MRNRVLALVAVSGLVLTACSSNDSSSDDTAAPDVTEQAEPEATEPEATEPEATEPETTEPETTEPETTEPEATEPETTEPEATEPEATEPETAAPTHTIEMSGCEQVAIYFPVEAAKALERVPADIELLVEDDQVTALFVANECTDTAVDGVSGGPAHVHAQWLAVAGPDEVREGPQFEGAPVLPTAYWEPIYTATDSPTMQELMEAAELDMLLVDSITVDDANLDLSPEIDGYLGHLGSATNADPPVDYAWITMNPWAGAEEIPYGDQVTGFVHVVGDMELETVGNIRAAGVPGCSVFSAVEPDDEGQTPDLPDGPLSGTPGSDASACYLVTYEQLVFETLY